MAKPLLVAVMHSDDDDPDYHITSSAYGLEMQIDNEWRAELVLLTPPEFLDSILEGTDVTGEDTAIVSAGIIDRSSAESSQVDYSLLSNEQDNWILIGALGNESTAESLDAKIREAISAKCRVVVCVTAATLPRLTTVLGELGNTSDGQLVLAAIPTSAEDAVYEGVYSSKARMRPRGSRAR